ncbi:uncharacterized protein BJ212DRAFT_1277764 [Suillus subaureus]|uniref:C3H1-type domain-containing protein n=1 Tax=Suillus subaureus TaxID=48587 RepID=A0A9P7E588_9AGAM|nr:uncharacterized protein BJ212DRAFT_1277764 [Suillus subaureus]KAG1811514.1 hypothetical protein BJ212DRAFT_1277764 [Suillus subaureus]
MASTSDAALKEEIARLTGAINQHKSTQQSVGSFSASRSNAYFNPKYRPLASYRPSEYQKPAIKFNPPSTRPPRPPQASSTRDVVIDGVTFESSTRSLVRKDLPKAPSVPPKAPLRSTPQQVDFSRTTTGHLIPAGRAYKPKASSRVRQRRPRNRNMTLDNTRGSQQSVHRSSLCYRLNLMTSTRRRNKRMKYLDKPCPRFTTTGACSRGLTCMYQHDPHKIAICWNFLHGNCSSTAETCNLSHDPTPERTPLCVHFANNGRCTRENCHFPHVRVGQQHGVCRDFAVLGYCAKGLDCEMQHVRECPDFAEKGSCSTKGCKLPHVIRANRNRKPPAPTASLTSDIAAVTSSTHAAVEDARLGDEYISLMFNESEEESDDDDDDEEEDNSGEEEGLSPTDEVDGSDDGPLT